MSEKMIFCLGGGRLKSEGEGYQKNCRVFNKDVTKKEYEKIQNDLNIKLKLTEWNEKTKLLNVYSYTDAWNNWWNSASKKDKESITKLKQFDAEIFKEITGIDINEKAEEMTLAEVCKELGRTIKIKK